ncbi:MAG: nitroreductase/quinone reductase family protein [Dehalococcoidia bacterium]
MAEYKKPGTATILMGRAMMLATKLGFSPAGAWTLAVKGRSSGEERTAPVNPLEVGGVRYLVAPRGETQWVRNIRVTGTGELRLGKKRQLINVEEVADGEKPNLIAAYLERWGNVTRTHFGTTKDPSDTELERLAGRTPVFRII